MSESPDRAPRTLPQPDAEAVTLPMDPELGNAPTVVANTVAVAGKRRRSDPFTLVSGESVSPQVDARAADIEETAGERRYERGAVIGAGGMGEVRLHVDRRIGRRVAKKTLHATIDSHAARQRFLREARVQGQLEHPAIVPVYDLDADEQGRAFFTMKRVRGLTLERVLERVRANDPEITRRFSTRKLLTAFAQVCLAIDYAHTRGVIHRDLKPGNVMLGDFGEVYLLDWGLAKVVGEAEDDADGGPLSSKVVGASAALTRGGALLGTPAYMAPEQLLRRTDEVDARSDVFALGAILFEIVARTPFRTHVDVTEIARRVEAGEIVRPSERAAGVAPELDEICARALARDPADRPARAREIAEAVERFLDGEQDAVLRKDLAARHAAEARSRAARVEAFRETMKALALDPENADAQRLLVDLLTDVSGQVPEEARRELRAAEDHTRAAGARLGMWGLLLWLAIFPAVALIGVRSWPVVLATAGMTALAAAFAYRLSRLPSYGIGGTSLLAALVAGIVAMTSCYMGPFAVVPTCAATASILFAMHATGRERWAVTAIVSAGALAPFVAEIAGLVPRAYSFEPDRLIVLARAIALPEGATHAAMIYSTLGFIVLEAVLMGRVRDALRALEERRFLQAWYLREIFPGGGGTRREGTA